MAEKKHGDKDMTVQEAGHLGGEEVQHQRDLRDRKEVRSEAYDKPGPPEGHAYGIAAVTQALSGLDFPASKQDVLKRAGSQQIEYRKGQPVSLKQILQGVDVDSFPSMSNIVGAVSDALKEEGLSGQSGKRAA